jgi:PAS domain S-box-containing protein
MQVLDLILGATRDAVFSQDLDGQIHNCSYSISDFIGIPANDIIGKNFTELFPSSERASAQFILSAIRRGRIVRDLNTEFEHANTAKVPVIITIAPLRDELGGLIGACILAKPRAEGGEDQNWRRERLMLEERYLNLQEELADLRQELRTMRPTGND